jgi:hypothetical protein
MRQYAPSSVLDYFNYWADAYIGSCEGYLTLNPFAFPQAAARARENPVYLLQVRH